jgi:hypothetical protein
MKSLWRETRKLPHADYTVADKGYDCEEIRHQIKDKSSTPSSQERKTLTLGMLMLIGVYINIFI